MGSTELVLLVMLQLKRKAREAGDTEAGVTLASGNDDTEEESGEQHEEEAWAGQHDQDSDEEAGPAYEGGLTSSDEDEQDERKLQQAVSSKAGQAAYFGMQRKQGSETAAAKEYEGLSLAEQEALALKMIKK